MAAAIKFPKSVIGEDGILRSEVEYDPKSLPVLKNSLGMHFLGLVQKSIEEEGDRVFLTNASLSNFNTCKDN